MCRPTRGPPYFQPPANLLVAKCARSATVSHMRFTRPQLNHTGQERGDAPPAHPAHSCMFSIVLYGLLAAVIASVGMGIYFLLPIFKSFFVQ